MEQKNKYSGLTDAEVAESRVVHGENVLSPPEKESVWKKFIRNENDGTERNRALDYFY